MIVYYRDPSFEVTSIWIRVGDRRYPLAELTHIWYRRYARSWRAVAGRGAWGMTLFTPVIAAVIGVVVAMQLDLSGGVRAIIITAAVLIGLGVGPLLDPVLGKLDESFDRGVHMHEIWAEYNGSEIRLLETPDAARFGRIYRALQRAAES